MAGLIVMNMYRIYSLWKRDGNKDEKTYLPSRDCTKSSYTTASTAYQSAIGEYVNDVPCRLHSAFDNDEKKLPTLEILAARA